MRCLVEMRIYGSKTDQSHLYLLLLIREHHLSHSQQRKYFKVGTILSVICVDCIMRYYRTLLQVYIKSLGLVSFFNAS